METLKNKFSANAQSDDLAIGGNIDLSQIDISTLERRDVIQSLRPDTPLSFLNSSDIKGFFASAEIDLKVLEDRGLTEQELKALSKAFERMAPEIASQLKEQYPEDKAYMASVREVIGYGPDASPAMLNFDSGAALLLNTGDDEHPRESLAGLMGVDESELPPLPLEIQQIPNLTEQIRAFTIIHELEHDHAQDANLSDIPGAQELDSDVGSFIALEAHIHPALMDYLVDARIVSIFGNGMFFDDIWTQMSGRDDHSHSMGFMLKNMLETADTPSERDMSLHRYELTNLIKKVRDEFDLLPEELKEQYVRPVNVRVYPEIGQIMTAIDRTLERLNSDPDALTENEVKMLTQFLEAADNAGFSRMETETYTQEYREAFSEWRADNAAHWIAVDYREDQQDRYVLQAIKGGLADRVKDKLPEDLKDQWDQDVDRIQKGLSFNADTTPTIPKN